MLFPLGIAEILICIVAVSVGVMITRKRPLLGIVLTLMFVGGTAFFVSYLSMGHRSSSRIRVASHEVVEWDEETNATTAYEIHEVDDGHHQSVVIVSHDEEVGEDECVDCEDACEDCEEEEAWLTARVEEEQQVEGDEASRDSPLAEDVQAEVIDDADFAEDAETELSLPLTVAKPDWVLDVSPRAGNSRRFVISSAPCASLEECDISLRRAIQETIAQYAQAYFESQGVGIPSWYRPELPRDELKDAITNEFVGTQDFEVAGVDPMLIKYVELRLSPRFHERVLDRQHESAIQMARVAQSGVGSLGVLGLLAAVLGLLKLDDATQAKRRRTLAVTGGLGMAVLLGFGLVLLSMTT